MNAFIRDKRGNFGLITALLSLPLMAGVGLAVDYGNLTRVRTQLQNAADAAALVAAKNNDKADSERRKLARSMFRGNYWTQDVKRVKIDLGEVTATVTVEAEPATFFMGLFGKKNVPLAVTSTAATRATTIEIVFVLDVSGSMNHTLSSGKRRIEELKSAVSQLVDDLETQTDYTVKAAYVPFNMNVNVGTGNKSFVAGINNPLFNGTEWKGCVFERAAPDHITDSPSGKWEAYIYPPMPDLVGTGDWNTNPSNGTNAGYQTLAEASATGSGVQYNGPNYNCVRHPIQPLTDNLATFKSKIQTLTAESNMGTLLAPGVTWGMRVLSPAKPFTEGRKYGPETLKVMVVVTDGEQVTEAEFSGDGVANQSKNSGGAWTFNPVDYGLAGSTINTGFGPKDNMSAYGFIFDSRPFGGTANDWQTHKEQLVDLSDAACAEAKKTQNGTETVVFSIGVSDATAPGTLAYKALQNCASQPEDHFYAKDKETLDKAFEQILTRVKTLRLTS